MAQSKKPLRVYSPEQRVAALELADRIGLGRAARELGMPAGTISCWRNIERCRRKEPPSDTTTTKPELPIVAAEATTIALPEPPPKPVVIATPGAGKVARHYTPSQRAQALEVMAAIGPAAATRQLGISRFSLFEWRRKQQAFSEGKTTDSPLVGSDLDKASERDQRILKEWKLHPGLGPSQVRNQLRRGGFKVSVRTVRMVMEEHGYVLPKVRRESTHDQRYEAVRRNQLWHLDFLQRHIHKQKVSVLFLIDDYSRFITGFAMSDEDRSEVVLECFESAVSRHGRPEAVMSDGGAAFWAWRGVSRFTRLLEEMPVDQLIAKVPQHNGKVEILNANVQKELFDKETFFDLAQTHARLGAWVSFYNLRRTHHALGGLLVPADRFFGRADEVLAQIQAGGSPEGIGEPQPVSDRHLDLLRVCSHAGKLEVLLMGERIWPQIH